jgi:Beta/Gamma crystallin
MIGKMSRIVMASIVGSYVGIANADDRSVPIPYTGPGPIPEIILYDDCYIQSPNNQTIREGFSYIGGNWNDRTRSINIVHGFWKLCKGANFEDCTYYRSGGTFCNTGWDQKLSSLCPIPANDPHCLR